MSEVKLVGMDKLKAKLQKCSGEPYLIKMVVAKNGNQLNEKMKTKMKNAYVTINPRTGKGYSTGDTADSVNTVITDNGMTASVGPTTNYSPYVEYGTRFMKAEPAVRPAFEEQVPIFKRDLEAVMK